jgi:hypothetical protein
MFSVMFSVNVDAALPTARQMEVREWEISYI